ncbi:adoMet-dependent rRNA methyltransferase spb1 [Macadamia integrifolia]|uniref:adoMet-dependent rRNA methyltransferase spb1 n=1 Tax=Macadamia integrifolia TaxID=60698 RepID=UPI001C4F5F03|nr:adoMet-dependent rRNA methyltransferase spb1 [Macadamia integrifolia]XP_042486099.1 adoMet-dependent rRNA methyltransferase spb1 [Macadamia integrifolia]
MGKVKGKHRLDKFYHLAKEQGYRSRAAFKLLQLEAKFSFLGSAHSVLDLCAAPGGWMQVAVQRVPVGSFVLGIDLFPIKPIRGAISVEEDITTQKCRSTIKKLMGEHGCRAFDLVLHDGSPNVGGAWAQEATSQAALVIDAVRLATAFLAPKGTFVTKVFRSQDYSAVLYCLKQLFGKVEVTKPVASRSSSAEIYVVGINYKAPAKIDPRLLNVGHLFQGAVETPKVVDVLRGTKQKRHRDGYEEGNTTLRKVCLASDFVWSASPLEILGSVSSISFDDPACLSIKDHSLTTEEIKLLCDDLRVLGKQDFKQILKWRMHIRKALSPVQKATAMSTDVEDEKEDEDEKMLNEMEELTYAMERKKKREKKLLSKRRAKDKARKATGKQIDALEDGYVDQELFSLSSIKGKKDLAVVDTTEADDGNGSSGDSENEETRYGEHLESPPTDVDSDEEQRRYDEQLEGFLDEAYERYLIRTGGSTKQRKRAKRVHSKDGKESLEGGEDDELVNNGDESDKEQSDNEANPLMVSLDEEDKQTKEQIMEKWFSQDIFAEAVEEGDLDKNDTEDEMEEDLPEEKLPIPGKVKKSTLSAEANTPKLRGSKVEEDFEIVPAPATDSSDDSSSDESEEEDDDKKAEILAYAKKMLRKKQREHILDDAYNKYMFDDDGLPSWFLEEEKRHRQPIKPVTKEEVAAMKAQFKEIDARPAKKVAQAKARKKRVAMRTLEKVRRKANTISDQTDISEQSKMKMIDRLYKKAEPKKPQKEYVVAKKGVQVKAHGKGKVLVDRRMKKDSRTSGMSKKNKGGSKKGKNMKGKVSGKASMNNKRKGNKGKK